MEPMKLNIQMFAPDAGTISINLYFKDIAESELPESLIFSFDGEQVTIPISGVSMNYVWNYWGSRTFNSITILSEGYLIIPYQIGNGIVDIDIYKNFSFVKKILEDNTINQTTPDFSQVATTNEGMFADFDNDGVSTYFRGAVTNNYVKFANFWWRIIRVNGNGSIRLIYDGTTAHANGESSTDRHIGTSAFNTNSNDNAYVGYMYGTPGSSTHEATHANVNDSSIKTTLDNWYESNLSNYSDYIDTEAGFCGDRTPYRGSGAGTTQTYYVANNRVVNNKQPTFECSNSSDLYTISGSSQGNKALQYPIGLISADEVAYAGGVWTTSNTSYYLYTNSAYWTMSPYYFLGSYASVFRVNSSGYLNNYSVNNALGVRPVINLRGDLSVTGTGTSTDPYEVSLPVVPATIFNGTELTNIYYNGTEISKMYCNGVLVFEKGPTVYKRRIMVGDNLTGKRIYFSFPDDYATIRQGKEPIGDFIVGNGSETIWENSLYEILVGEYSYVYIPDMLNSPSILSNDIGSVTNIEDCLAYRCCYIEDPNIRPVQVGDNLNGATLYFIIPDDFTWNTNLDEVSIDFYTDNSWITMNFLQDNCSLYIHDYGNTNAQYGETTIFDKYINDTEIINLSSITLSNNFGTLINLTGIEYEPRFNSFILVDITTLG